MAVWHFSLNDASGNENLDLDTLAIDYQDEPFAASASVGFLSDKKTARLNRFVIGRNAIDPNYVHELGHVLGQSHEHQRPDRKSRTLPYFTSQKSYV